MPELKENTHFVAHLKIEKVEKTPSPVRGMTSEDRGHTTKRVIDEVTQITIKADTLDGLTDKLGKHIAIIEED